MKEYPSIGKEIRTDVNIFGFNKLDGSNVRSEWSRKRGFYKFGSKTQLIGEDDKILGESIQLIRNKYQDALGRVFCKEKYDNVTCFFEFFGPNSFAGHHDLTEKHDVVLFDVSVYRKGFLDPSSFIDLFESVDTPKVLYYGKANSFFVEKVRGGTLEGMGLEGVVCKGKSNNHSTMPIMFKIKSRAWLDRLKGHCQGDDKLFQQLA